MDNIFKIIDLIPEKSENLITINLIKSLDKSSSESLDESLDSKCGTYTMEQERFHQLLRRVIAKFKVRYIEKKHRLYRWRDIYMVIDCNKKYTYYSKHNVNNYLNDNLMLSIDNIKYKESNSMPKLNAYHSIVQHKIREININNRVIVNFIEEHNNNNIINYIEISCKYVDNSIKPVIYEIISIITS